jgi:hypothetical protein
MVNLVEDFFGKESLTQRWEKPDFSAWVSADKTARYLDSIWDYTRAKEVREVQQLSPNYPVVFVLCPPGVAAYVAPWSSNKIHYNLFTLGRQANHEHIIRHESIHLEHQARWGSTDLPGFDKLNSFAQSCFARVLWTAFDERMILEWYTEGKATDQTEYDPDCGYNLHEVPISERFDDLVRNRSSLSGLDFSTSRAFSQMGMSGSREEFWDAVMLTANQLMLEQAAADMWVKVDDVMATKMSFIGRDLLQSGQVLDSFTQAQKILNTSPVGSIQVRVSTRDNVSKIGIEMDKPSTIKSGGNIESAVNVFGDILKKESGWEWKIITMNTANKAIGVLSWNRKSAAEANELPLAA